MIEPSGWHDLTHQAWTEDDRGRQGFTAPQTSSRMPNLLLKNSLLTEIPLQWRQSLVQGYPRAAFWPREPGAPHAVGISSAREDVENTGQDANFGAANHG